MRLPLSHRMPPLFWHAHTGDLAGATDRIAKGDSVSHELAMITRDGSVLCGVTALYLAAQVRARANPGP